MAYRYFVDQEINCIFVRHTGATCRDEIDDLLGEVFEDDKFYGNMNILRDMRETELSDEFEYSAFKKWADESIGMINKKLGKCRVAWVLGSRDDFAKVHRIKHIFRFKYSSVEIDGFRKLESALSWLDIPSDYDIHKFDRD